MPKIPVTVTNLPNTRKTSKTVRVLAGSQPGMRERIPGRYAKMGIDLEQRGEKIQEFLILHTHTLK